MDDARGGDRSVPTAFAFDLDGTVYLGDTLLPGAREFLHALAEGGVPHVFATNNSSDPGSRYVERLQRLGIAASREQVLTSNDVAIAHLRTAGVTRPLLLATPDVVREYREHGYHTMDDDPDADRNAEPEAVVLTFDTTLTYDKLARAAHWIRAGVPYFATHPDKTCPTPLGPIPDCGSFIALLEHATGRSPTILGKPQRQMADAIRSRLDRPAADIAFVGDRLYTDVRMANENGFLAVLTLTGETTADDLGASEHTPDVVVANLSELQGRTLAIQRRGSGARTPAT
jgi:HAD superfamily hydrolase (TIGR01450 family)